MAATGINQEQTAEMIVHISLTHDLSDKQSVMIPPARSLLVCSNRGLRLYDLLTSGEPELKCRVTEYGAVNLAEKFLGTDPIVMVRAATPRCLYAYHMDRETVSQLGSYRNQILAVKLSLTKIVVVIEDQVVIVNAMDGRVFHVIQHTTINPESRACALTFQSHSKATTLFAYPSDRNRGDVEILNIEKSEALPAISAHDSEVVALSFNAKGNLIATASEKGTVIRVFLVHGRILLHELQRGLMRCANIQSLAFKHDSTMLACSSDKETVHLFKINEDPDFPDGGDDSLLSYIGGSIFQRGVSLLPSTVAKVLNRDRAVAIVSLQTEGGKTIAAWSNHHRSLLVISREGVLRMFKPQAESGEWPEVLTYSLKDDGS